MSKILFDNTLNIRYVCKNNELSNGVDKNCNTIQTTRNRIPDRKAIQSLPRLTDKVFEDVDINRLSTTELVKRRALRNKLILKDNCKVVKNNKKIFTNNSHTEGYYYLRSDIGGVKTYDYYRKINDTHHLCKRIVVPSGKTLKEHLLSLNQSKRLTRYTFNRYEGGTLIRNKYEFCNGYWEFVGEV